MSIKWLLISECISKSHWIMTKTCKWPSAVLCELHSLVMGVGFLVICTINIMSSVRPHCSVGGQIFHFHHDTLDNKVSQWHKTKKICKKFFTELPRSMNSAKQWRHWRALEHPCIQWLFIAFLANLLFIGVYESAIRWTCNIRIRK